MGVVRCHWSVVVSGWGAVAGWIMFKLTCVERKDSWVNPSFGGRIGTFPKLETFKLWDICPRL